MSKLGRYSADRKKVADIDGATTIKAAQCGTIFMCDDTGDAGYTITMPSLADVGPGWWAKFVVNCAAGSTLADGSGDDILFSTEDDSDAIVIHIDIANSLSADDAADTVTIDNTAVKGTHVTWWTDGTTWFVEGVGGSGMIAIAT